MTDNKIRKYQNTLVVAGNGVILFGLWNIVKCIMMFLFTDDRIWAAIEELEIEVADSRLIYYILIVIVSILLLVEMILRVYVGRSAIKEGKGKQGKKGYLIVAVVFGIALLANDVATFWAMSLETLELDTIMSAIVDLTSCYAVFDLVYSAIRLRLWQKGGAGDAG